MRLWNALISVCSGCWAIGIVVAAYRMPRALGGPNLAVLFGRSSDPHLLTSFLWRAVASLGGDSSEFVQAISVAMFALLTAAVGVVVWRASRNAALAAAAAALLAASPFGRSLVLDPIAPESITGLALLLLAGADLVHTLKIPVALRIALAPAIVLQSPEFTAAAVLYALTMRLERRDLRFLAVAITTVLSALRFSHVSPVLSVRMAPSDSTPFMLTMIVLAAICVAAPAVLATARTTSESNRRLFTTLSLLFLIGGLAAAGGATLVPDPSAAFFGAEIYGILFLATLSAAGLVKAAMLAGCVALTALAWTPAQAHLPSITIARQGAALRTALERHSGAMCIIENAAADRLLAGGAFLRLYGHGDTRISGNAEGCLFRQGSETRAIAVFQSSDVQIWDRSTMNLARAVAMQHTGAVALEARGLPEIPGSSGGVFSGVIDTPLGGAKALTITAGHSYTFHCVALQRASHLTFAASNPLAALPNADPVNLRILVSGREQFLATFAPSRSVPPSWTYFDVALPPARGCADVTLKSVVPLGRAIGAWTRIVAPAISGS